MKLNKAQVKNIIYKVAGDHVIGLNRLDDYFERQKTNYKQLVWFLLKRAKFTRKLMRELFYIEYGDTSITEAQAYDFFTRFSGRIGDLLVIKKELEKYVLEDVAVRVTKIKTLEAMRRNGEL